MGGNVNLKTLFKFTEYLPRQTQSMDKKRNVVGRVKKSRVKSPQLQTTVPTFYQLYSNQTKVERVHRKR